MFCSYADQMTRVVFTLSAHSREIIRVSFNLQQANDKNDFDRATRKRDNKIGMIVETNWN